MNDKDKEQFFLLIDDAEFYPDYHIPNPIAICSYQAFDRLQKLQSENARLQEVISYLPKVPTKPYEKEMAITIRELQAENDKLKLIAKHYAQADDVGAYARMILKEIKEK